MKISKIKLKKIIESFLLEAEDEDVVSPENDPDASFTDALKALKSTAEKITPEKATETLIKIPKQIVDFLNLKPNDDPDDVKLTKADIDKVLKSDIRNISIKLAKEKEEANK